MENVSNGLISVIIPNYNRIEQLKRAVKSVLDQTISSFEIIVIDDFSDFDPQPVLISIHDSRIQLIRLKEKRNAAVARNIGILHSKGEFISFLDSDDAYMPLHFEKRLKLLRDNPQYDGTYGSAIRIRNNITETYISSQIEKSDSMLEYLLCGRFKACTPSLFLRREPTKNIMFDESLYQHQDYEFNIRFHEKYRLLCDPEPSVLIYSENVFNMGRNIHHDSCIRFIDRYKNTVNRKTYRRYLFSQLKNEFNLNGETYYYNEYKKRLFSDPFDYKYYLKILSLRYFPIRIMLQILARLINYFSVWRYSK